VRPRFGIVEDFPQLLGRDRQVDRADEAERCALDEIQVDVLAREHLRHGLTKSGQG
jgi:hypothetical protein